MTTLAHFPVPTGREEAWRFTPLDRLRGLHSDASPLTPAHVEWSAQSCSVSNVSVSDLGDFQPVDRVAERAWAQTAAGFEVRIPREATDATATVRITSVEGDAATSHIRVVAEPFSAATVILEHAGTGSLIGNVDVDAGDSSELTVVSIQDWSSSAVHLGQHAIRVGRDARVRHVVVTLGGDVVRLLPTVDYSGPGGAAELLGVFLASAGEHIEHRLHVEHREPHCSSNVAYKGALTGDDAHSVWIGDVMVRHSAIGTDTYELNRNLLLSEGARADSVPNLELETGEIVGAGHASATGRFDDEQLFYLQSRGIPEDLARALVVRGFFADVVARIGDPELIDSLMHRVDARLEALGMAHVGVSDE